MAYVKLFGSILASTIWQEDPTTKIVWITLLAMADRDGLVEASVPGLARMAGVTVPECEAALDCLESPDPHSRTRAHEGRRIEADDGGWILLNYEFYRDKASKEDKREKDAARQRRKYERDKAKSSRNPHAPHATSPDVTNPRLSSDLTSPDAPPGLSDCVTGSPCTEQSDEGYANAVPPAAVRDVVTETERRMP